MTAALAPGVEAGIEDLMRTFPERVSHVPTGDGGADVTVADVELGDTWTRDRAPLSFNLAYNYPHTPVYPYYLPTGTMPRAPGRRGVREVQRNGERIVQVSLRHNDWDPSVDTAVGSVLQVQAWAQRR